MVFGHMCSYIFLDNFFQKKEKIIIKKYILYFLFIFIFFCRIAFHLIINIENEKNHFFKSKQTKEKDPQALKGS